MKKLGLAVALAAIFAAPVANAATQCFPSTGTYGAVDVVVSGNGCVQNFSYSFPSLVLFAAEDTCTLSFSKPLLTSSFTIDFGGADQAETTAVATNSGAYNVQPADVTAPSPVYNQSPNAAASGGLITHPEPNGGGGQFRFVSAPPASISSLTLTKGGIDSGIAYRVCADDAGAALPAVPTITAVSPATSDTSGGVTITINGTNFTGATSVTFGGVAATTFTVLSATSITATVPAQTPGVKEVIVTSPQGSNDTAPTTNDFTVTPAVIPTMTELAMILFGMILAGGAALVVQRRRMAA